MKEIAVIGSPAFTLGFSLAGIRHVNDVNENPAQKVQEILDDENVGIIIMSQEIKDTLDSDLQQRIGESVSPVVVTLGDEGSDDIKRLIKKSIGIELG